MQHVEMLPIVSMTWGFVGTERSSLHRIHPVLRAQCQVLSSQFSVLGSSRQVLCSLFSISSQFFSYGGSRMKSLAHRTPRLSLALVIMLALAMLTTAGPPTRAAADCAGPLHPKSAAGEMPPACGLDPDAPAPAMLASLVDFLGPAINTRVGSWAHLVAAADLNNDQVDEAAVGTADYFDEANDWQIHLLKQFADTFERIQQRPARKYAEAITALDANQDDLMDLAVAGADGVLLFTQAVTGTLPLREPIEVLTGTPVDALAVGDVNGDLHPDLLAIAPEADTILAWISHPTGLEPYPLELDYPTDGYSALAVGDLNNDGFDDLAALRGSGYATDSVVVFLQMNGSFPVSFKLTPQTGGYLPHSLAVGDVTGDGLDDLVVTAGGNTPHAYLNVFPQQVTDATTTPPTSSLADHPVVYDAYHLPGAVQIGDINHDGRADVIVANDSWRTIGVYTQAADGTLNPYAVAQIPYNSRYRPNALALGDFDGNGGMDVAVVGRDPGLTVLPNTDTAPVATISTPPDAAVIPPGSLTVTGTTTTGTTAVEVRVKGLTDWQPATLTGTTWEITIDDIPDIGRSWWIEARAIAGTRYQAPPARHRVQVLGRVTDGILVLYTFAERTGDTVFDVGGIGDPLNLEIADPTAVRWEDGRLVVTDPTVIVSPGAATKIIDAVGITNAISLEAWVTPANVTQDGPARIVGISKDSRHLNVLLGQGLGGNLPSDLVNVHLRTSETGTYMRREQLRTPPGSITPDLVHILYTRDAAGHACIYLNGQEAACETLTGNFANWDAHYRLLLANEERVPRPWLGTYHLVALYERALTPAEVVQNFRAGPEATGSIPAPLSTAHPYVQSLTINNRADSSGSRQVPLTVAALGATPDRTVRSVLFTEYVFNPVTEAWVQVQQSDWQDYPGNPNSSTWELDPTAGVHYLHVWARDDQGTISQFPAEAFINYVPDADTLAVGQTRVYRYMLRAGAQFTARIEPRTGDPDLMVWAPSDMPLQPWVSNLREQPDIISFAVPMDGVYQIEVTGYTAADYRLTVERTPAVQVVSPADTISRLDPDKAVRTAPLVLVDSEPAFAPPVSEPIDTERQLFLPVIIR